MGTMIEGIGVHCATRELKCSRQQVRCIAEAVNVFIGPEGGWENQEIERARQAGVISVKLGPTLLRTETAGLIAATLVLREFGVY